MIELHISKCYKKLLLLNYTIDHTIHLILIICMGIGGNLIPKEIGDNIDLIHIKCNK